MSRILAQSVTADLFGRLFNRLLFLLLLPVIMIIAFLSLLRHRPEGAAASAQVRGPVSRSKAT